MNALNTANASDKFSARHFLVMLTVMLILACPACIVTGINGIFLTTVCTDLGYSRTQISMFITIMYVVATLLMPSMSKIMTQKDPRLVVSIGIILAFVTRFSMSFFTAPWQFWITGVIDGIGSCITMFLTAGIIVNGWFRKRFGLIIGIVLASSGIGGMIWASLGSAWIASFGWRVAWRYLAFATLIPLPFSLLVLRRSPAEVGKKAYGEDEVNRLAAEKAAKDGGDANIAVRGVSKGIAVKSTSFRLIIVMGLSFAIAAGFNNYTSSYISSLGISGVVGAGVAVTVISFGNMAGKITLGFINDFSGKVGCIFAASAGLIGLFIIRTSTSIGMVYVGCALFGLMVGGVTAEIACMTKICFGPREYGSIYGITMATAALGSGFSATIYGMIVDAIGGYTGIFNFAMVLAVVALITAFMAIVASKKLVHTTE